MLDAAAGLTRIEAENAFSLSLVRHGRLAADVLWEIKSGMLKKSGLLTLYRGGETFADLGGLEALKTFCRRALRPGRPAGVRAAACSCSAPRGRARAQFCKALGCETGRPTLMLDVGALLGSLVGQRRRTSARRCGSSTRWLPASSCSTRSRRHSRGSRRAGQTDSGVSARMFGTFLTWLNDHESDAFVVCTSNDVSKLPPEFARRAVRRNVLPRPAGSREKEAIWRMYLAKFGLDPEAAPAARHRLHRRRDQGVLPAGGAAGRAAGRGGAEHRPGGRDGRRVGRAAPAAGPAAAACRPSGPGSTRAVGEPRQVRPQREQTRRPTDRSTVSTS